MAARDAPSRKRRFAAKDSSHGVFFGYVTGHRQGRLQIGGDDMTLSHSLTPLSDSEAEVIRAHLVFYWKAVATDQKLIGVLGEQVHETEAKVTELLQQNTAAAVYEASRITARFE